MATAHGVEWKLAYCLAICFKGPKRANNTITDHRITNPSVGRITDAIRKKEKPNRKTQHWVWQQGEQRPHSFYSSDLKPAYFREVILSSSSDSESLGPMTDSEPQRRVTAGGRNSTHSTLSCSNTGTKQWHHSCSTARLYVHLMWHTHRDMGTLQTAAYTSTATQHHKAPSFWFDECSAW